MVKQIQTFGILLGIALLIPSCSTNLNMKKEIVIDDFETDSYVDWTVEGAAFGTAPAKGAFEGQRLIMGYKGEGFVNSCLDGNASTGRLISSSFNIDRDYLGFLIGGGNLPGKVGLNVLVDGKIVASASGDNSETLKHQHMNLTSWKGQQAVIHIVDSSSDDWGYITVDQIVLSDDPIVDTELQLEASVNKRYLNIPLMMDRKTDHRNMDIMIDGLLLGTFRVPLASDQEDFYGFIDLSQHQGKTLTIEVDRFHMDLSGITLDDEIKGAENLYDELFRPQLHFSTKRGWINDPNGLIYYKGEYHMYYQHNPFSVYWGNMSWGHAVSKNLVHWEEQPVVLFPDPGTGDCFSGAAFIDRWNQLGMKTGDEDVLLAFYLRTKSGLSLAYSNDRGQTMTDYEGNPVLTHTGARIDTPRPFWFEPTNRWVAPTYDFFTNKDGKMLRCVGIYSSADLKDWRYESRVEQDKWGDEICGCVDFFQLPVDGDPDDKKWVMVFIDGSYIVGTFDGRVFYTLSGKPAITKDRIRSLVIQGNYYATMTWHNMPDDRRVQITWMRGGSPEDTGMPFSQQMTLPSELTLHSTEKGPCMRMNPIKELGMLRVKTHKWDNIVLNDVSNPLSNLDGELYEIEVEFSPVRDSETVFGLRDVKVSYDAAKEELSCNEIKTHLKPENGKVKLQMFIDRTSVEVYANNGLVYLPLINMMPPDNLSYSATATGGEVKVETLRVHELNSIWSGTR